MSEARIVQLTFISRMSEDDTIEFAQILEHEMKRAAVERVEEEGLSADDIEPILEYFGSSVLLHRSWTT